MKRSELERYLASYLKVELYDDASLNGLQVEGREEVRRSAFAVSACSEAFERAARGGADALVVHHGLLWKGDGVRPVVGLLRRRLGLLFNAELNLLAYHLPLDAHPEVGNNAVAARELGLREIAPFCDYKGSAIGVRGSLPNPEPWDAFLARLEGYYGHRALAIPPPRGEVETVGIVSGAAAREAEQAVAEGLDAYVTGEPSEPVTYLCREEGLGFAALGHYATERVGIRALAAHLERELGLEAFFIEVENEA